MDRWRPDLTRWLVLLIIVAAAVTLLDLWAPLVLATWVGVFAQPLQRQLTRLLRGPHRASVVLTVLLLLLVLAPIAYIIISLTTATISLVQAILHSKGGRDALETIVSGAPTAEHHLHVGLGEIIDLVRQYGARAWSLFARVAGATLTAFLGVFVFVYASYTFLADGPRGYQWLREHAPVRTATVDRLAAAFNETGRGLLLSIGLTAVAQGGVATAAYLVIGVPRPYVLGFMTAVASFIPSVGTALIWVPVAIGLAIVGRWWAAAGLLAVGFVVIGLVIDHLVRPKLSQLGRLRLPVFVVLVSMIAGLALFGPWGLLLGPLLVRLGREALEIADEQRMFDRREGPPDAGAD